MNNDMNNDMDMGEDMEHETLNRNELMELTGKQLAKMAQPYSTLQLNSLERMAKAKLCDIILNKTDKKKDDDKPHARTARTESQSEQFISTALLMLDGFKTNRDGEPLNATAKEIFKKQAIVYADEKVNSGEMDINKSSNALLFLSAGVLIFDGLIGFKNAPSLFQKVKNRFTKKKDDSK